MGLDLDMRNMTVATTFGVPAGSAEGSGRLACALGRRSEAFTTIAACGGDSIHVPTDRPGPQHSGYARRVRK